MQFKTFFILLIVVQSSIQCKNAEGCDQCILLNCKAYFLKNHKFLCSFETVDSSSIVYGATKATHCRILKRISQAWEAELTSTSEAPSNKYLSPKLLPLATIDKPEAVITTEESTTISNEATTIPPPDSTQNSNVIVNSSDSTKNMSIEQPPTMQTKDNATDVATLDKKSSFMVVNRQGIAVLTRKKIQTDLQKAVSCEPTQYSNRSLFEGIPTTKKCISGDLTVDAYLRTLCVLAQQSSSSSSMIGLLDADRLYLAQNPAHAYNYTCSTLNWKKKFCLTGKRLNVPKWMKIQNKRRETNFFADMTTEVCAQNATTPLQDMARMLCRASVLSSLIPVSSFSHFDMAYVMMSPVPGYESYCNVLFYNRKNCYVKKANKM